MSTAGDPSEQLALPYPTKSTIMEPGGLEDGQLPLSGADVLTNATFPPEEEIRKAGDPTTSGLIRNPGHCVAEESPGLFGSLCGVLAVPNCTSAYLPAGIVNP